MTVQSRRWGIPDNIFFATDARRKMDAAVIGATAARIGGMFLLTQRRSSGGGTSIGDLKMQSTTDRLFMVGSGASAGR